MAYTEIHPIKSTLDKAIAYICNPEKTDGKLFISTFGCSHETADIEFQFTLAQTKIRKGDNLAHHLIQAFDPGETTPEQAHEIGKKLADTVTGGKYEYVLATHIDKGHVHNHIMFCAANFIDRTKYNSNKKSLYQIRNANDKLCREYNLSTIIPWTEQGFGRIEFTDDSGQRVTRPAKSWAKSRDEYNVEKKGTGWKAQLRKAIDGYIAVSSDFEDMLKRMEADGYSIKRAKYHSYKMPDADEKTRFTGGPSLGPEYTDERIRERIAGLVKAPVKKVTQRQQYQDGSRNLITNIEDSIKAQQNAGYANKVLINNLKIAASTVNYLTENNLLQDWQLRDKIAEVKTAEQQTFDTLKQVDKRIADMGLLMKNVETYQRTKPIYEQYRKAKNKEQFFREHESDIILHGAARNALKAIQADSGKLPHPNTLRAEYEQLTQEKNQLYAEHNALRKQVKKLDTLQANIDRILNTSGQGREPEKDKSKDVDL